MSVGWIEEVAWREPVAPGPDSVTRFEPYVTMSVEERVVLVRAVRALARVQMEELNGRLCRRPESAEDQCCGDCRALWREIDEVLDGPVEG